MAKASEIALMLSEGVFATFTNLLLFSFFWVGSSVGKRGSYGAARAFEEALGELSKANYFTIKRALYRLRQEGLVECSKEKDGVVLFLSKKGEKEVARRLFLQQDKKEYSGRIFVIIYDIPEEKRNLRNSFRRFLKREGCGHLQKSVWVTPFDPKKSISSFVKENGMSGSVIVSSFGKQESFARERIANLIKKAYKLDKLDRRYHRFLQGVSGKEKIGAKDFLSFISILKDDPQLPPVLLPKDWKGKVVRERIIEKIERKKPLAFIKKQK